MADDETTAAMMAMFGASGSNIRKVLGAGAAQAAAAGKLTNLAVKVGVEMPEIMASNLLTKVDMYLTQLADRFAKPEKKMFGAGGEKATACVASLTTLSSVIHYRIALAESGMNGIPIPPKVITAIESILGMGPNKAVVMLEYEKYGVKATGDELVNLLIAMSELIAELNAKPTCKAARLVNFAENTATSPGPGKLGTKTFAADVKSLFKFVIEQQNLLERSAVITRLQKEEDAVKKARYDALVTRLRLLQGLPARPTPFAELQARFAKLRGNGPMGGGAYKNRKTRRGRKSRKTLKGGRKTNKSRKNRKQH